MSEGCDRGIHFSYSAVQVDAVPHKQEPSTVRARPDRHCSKRLAIELLQQVRRNPSSEWPRRVPRAETGPAAKQRDYTCEPLWSATPCRGTPKFFSGVRSRGSGSRVHKRGTKNYEPKHVRSDDHQLQIAHPRNQLTFHIIGFNLSCAGRFGSDIWSRREAHRLARLCLWSRDSAGWKNRGSRRHQPLLSA